MKFEIEVPQATVDALTKDAITKELASKLSELNNRAIAVTQKTLGEALVTYIDDPEVATMITRLKEIDAAAKAAEAKAAAAAEAE